MARVGFEVGFGLECDPEHAGEERAAAAAAGRRAEDAGTQGTGGANVGYPARLTHKRTRSHSYAPV